MVPHTLMLELLDGRVRHMYSPEMRGVVGNALYNESGCLCSDWNRRQVRLTMSEVVHGDFYVWRQGVKLSCCVTQKGVPVSFPFPLYLIDAEHNGSKPSL